MEIVIGETLHGPLKLDVEKFMRTRAFVQGTSGSGKSYLLRLIHEALFGIKQQFIICPEGEFITLQEHYGYLICSPKDGDIELRVERAAEIAQTCFRRRVSVIFDVSDLSLADRRDFMVGFSAGLLSLPRADWHHCVVTIDEAEIFAPQRGKAAESLNAVIELSVRGRKRGICLMLASTRISKLHKDAAAELKNKFIGGASLDTDMKRAAGELGWTSQKGRDLLPKLSEGEFFCYGPAMQPQPLKVKVGAVKSKHGLGAALAVDPVDVSLSDRKRIAQEIQAEAHVDDEDLEEANVAEPAAASTKVSPERQEEADRRLRLIKPILRRSAKNRAPAIKKAAKEAGTSEATIERWISAYEAGGGAEALIPKKKGRKAVVLPPQVEKIITKQVSKVKGTRTTTPARTAYRGVVRECERLELEVPPFALVNKRYFQAVGAQAGARA